MALSPTQTLWSILNALTSPAYNWHINDYYNHERRYLADLRLLLEELRAAHLRPLTEVVSVRDADRGRELFTRERREAVVKPREVARVELVLLRPLLDLRVEAEAIPASGAKALLQKISFADARGQRFAVQGRPSR